MTMAEPQQPTYWVIAPCGAWNHFDDRETAQDEKQIHESLCDQCDHNDCELKSGYSIENEAPVTDA